MTQQKRVLIISDPQDLHAQAVAYAIREKGHFCAQFHSHDFPTLLGINFKISNKNDTVGVRRYDTLDDDRDPSDYRFDTIWLRRRFGSWLPNSMHPGDREAAKRQCDHLLGDFLASLDSEGTFWVNHYEPDPTNILKVYQLREAVRAGLTIPETLVSNDPQEIREFIRQHGGLAAHKLLHHVAWIPKDRQSWHLAYTSPVTPDDLPRDTTLRLCPAILQPLLKKSFEVRVACFGEYLISVQIDSQAHSRARVDWRAGQFQIPMRPYTLPEELAAAIRRYVRSTKMACVSLDFIVTPDGEHIFLEANPNGQFLWIEVRTGLPVLDAFSQFLISARWDFEPDPNSTPVSMRRFSEVWNGGLCHRVERHVLIDETASVPEDPDPSVPEQIASPPSQHAERSSTLSLIQRR